MDKRVDRRTARAEIFKEKVLTSAKELFIEHGFKETTIKMIANHADIGYGTAYNHFPNGKDEIFLIIVEEIMEDFHQVANNAYTVDSKESAFSFIEKNIESLISLVLFHKKLLVVLHEAIHLSELIREKWEDIIKRLIDRIAINVEQAKAKNLARNPDYDSEIVAGVLFYVVEGYLWKIVLDKTTKSFEAIVRNITEMYTNGLYT